MLIIVKQWIVILPYLIILGINEFERLRINIRNFNQQQFKLIDNFYLNNYYPQRIYKIYDLIIDDLNKTIIKHFVRVTEIICFRIQNEKLNLYNSSKLILNIELADSTKFIEGLEGDMIKRNTRIIINGISNNKNLSLIITGNSQKFLFIMLYENYLNIPIITRSLVECVYVPSLKYLVKLLELDYELHNTNRQFLDSIRKKFEFVLKSINAMHYVRNKLSPPKTLSELAYKYFFQSRKDDMMVSFIKDSISKSLNNFKKIEKHAKYILEKSENPFVVDNIEIFNIGKLINLIRKTSTQNLDSLNMSFNIDITQAKETFVKYDEIILEIVFSDLFENISKYYNGTAELQLTYLSNVLEIIVENDVDFSKVKIGELKKLVDNYNSHEKWEINEQSTHGLTLVKSYLNQMSIENYIKVDEKTYYFYVILNTSHEQDTSI